MTIHDPHDRLRKLSPEKRALLARRLQQTQSVAHTIIPQVSRDEHQHFPVSFAQQRLWFLQQWDPSSVAYHVPALFQLNGTIDHTLMTHCLADLVARHEILRTTINVIDDEPRQHIHPAYQPTLRYVDLRDVDAASQQEQIAALHHTQTSAPYDLARDPMMRALLVQTHETRAQLLLTIHHIACDGWSMGILLRELSHLYQGYLAQQPVTLEPLAVQYADYAHWHRHMLQGAQLTRLLDYWQRQLAGQLPVLTLPTDYPRPLIKQTAGATVSRTLPVHLLEQLEHRSYQANATVFMTLMTAFHVLLSRYTGQTDIIVGTPIANRQRQELEAIIGFFVNTLPIRSDLSGNPSFSSVLQRMRQTALDAYDHQDIPIELLIEKLSIERNLGHTPLFQALFVLQNMSIGGTVDLPEFDMQFLGAEATNTAKFDISLNMSGHRAVLEYDTALFTAATAHQMLDHFHVLLEAIVQNPDTRINDLALLTAVEQQRILHEWNATELVTPAVASLVEVFEAQVARCPNALAVCFEGRSYTYSELNTRANQLAHMLRTTYAIQPDDRVGLFIDRSLELMVGALGVLKAGGAYVPLDPIYPNDRIGAMIEDAAMRVMLTTSDLVSELAAVTIPCVALDRDWTQIATYSPANPVHVVQPQHLMYVLFTSGSTGRPKGVAVEHRHFLNYLHGIRQHLQLDDGLSYALVSTFAADLGTTNVYGALCSGGTLHLIAYERATDPAAFVRYFREHRIDVMKMVPSHFAALQTTPDWADAIPHKLLILAGEASSWDLFASIRQQRPDVRLENHYGPTETTVSMLTYPVPDPFPQQRSATVPLGRPIGNVNIYVLNPAMQPVPVGVAGELYISGAGVARGYLNRPEQTRDRFIANPFNATAPYDRLYRTGDVVRYRPDGVIEFLGRADHQVKIRGYRVELSEIEVLLKQHINVADAVVVLREDTPGDKRLVAYVVGQNANASDPKLLRDHLRNHVPDYMIPSVFVPLAALPLNLNGKIDRLSLPVPDPSQRHSTEMVAPRTATEQHIAQVWAEILHIDAVSIDDNFFDLGGESFKAIRVVQKLDAPISVMDVFKYPTVRELAQFISGDAPQASDSLLFDLTPRVKQRTVTVVAVPYGGGSAVIYQPLAHALPKNYGLYSLALPGHDFSRPDEPLLPLSELAQRAVDDISATIDTPIVIYGHCVGSSLAVEIARRLEQRGISVHGVILGGNFPAPRLPGKLFELFAKVFPADRWMTDRVYRDFLRVLGGFTEDMPPAEQRFVMNSLRHDARQAEDYYTTVFNNKQDYTIQAPIVCVIGEMDRATEFYAERYREWEVFTPDVQLEVIPDAGHYFLKHQAQPLAQIIEHHTNTWIQQPTNTPQLSSEVPTATPPKAQRLPSLRVFFTIAIGQLISMIGSSFTSFALGIWIYTQTGSVSAFATIAVIAILPAIVIAPLAGAVADRYDRRTIMIISDSVAAATTLILALLVWQQQLEIWHLYISSSIASIAGTFQRPAYVAAMTQLVPKAYLGKANGLIQLSSATGGILAPVLGGVFLTVFGLTGMFVIDLVSFLVAVTTLLLVRFPNTLFKKRDEPLIQEIVHGWRYIVQRPSLVAMVVFFALGNIWFGLASILVAPLVLAYATPAEWGFVSAASAIGIFAGGLVMSLWGGTRRRAEGMIGFVVLEGLCIAVMGLRPSPVLAACGLFGMWFSVALVNAHWQVLIQTKVGLELQGRVQATNQMLAMLSIPLGYVLAGPLADRFFEPLLAANGTLAPSLGWLFGVGVGRGVGLMMALIGIVVAVWAIIGFRYRPLRYMEDVLPDAIPDPVMLKRGA